MPTVDEVLAEAEIRSLLPRERYYRDAGEWEKMRRCYHPKSTETWVNVSWYTGEIDGFISDSKKMWQEEKATQLIHTIVPGEITINGDRALSISTCQILARHDYEGTELDFSSWIRLVSRLAQVETNFSAEWKILTLEAVYLRDSIALTAPSAEARLQGIDHSRIGGFRQSYKYISWHVSLYGSQVRDDLPGSDDQKSVEALLARNYAWLDLARS